MKLKFIVIILLIIVSPFTRAQDTIGIMQTFCELQDGNSMKTYCYSYISGVIDVQSSFGLTHKSETIYTCFPEGVTARQGAAIFVKWAKENPEQHHKLAHFGVIESLRNVFPCGLKN
jgi:hypothetical protein